MSQYNGKLYCDTASCLGVQKDCWVCHNTKKLYRDLGVLECRLAKGGGLQYREVYCNKSAGWQGLNHNTLGVL